MKIVFTDQALISINTAFDFLALQEIPREKIAAIFEKIFNRIVALAQMPYIGQREYITSNSDKAYRRIIESHFKIIYYIHNDSIYITDIFDTRQDPDKLKG
jgi:toxin ParE1/3/4